MPVKYRQTAYIVTVRVMSVSMFLRKTFNILLVLIVLSFITDVNSVPSEKTPPAQGVSEDQQRVDQVSKNGNKSSGTTKPPSTTPNSHVTTPETSTPNVTCVNPAVNCTDDSEANNGGFGKFIESVKDNKDMLLRTFYVLIAVTSVVVLYFVVRAWRIRRRKSKSRKYGLITSRGSDLEMAPLDADDDDDEDMTVYQMNNRRK